MDNETKFTDAFIEQQWELAEDRTHGTWTNDPDNGDVCVLDGDDGYDGIARFYRDEDQAFGIAAANHYPAALDAIERLRAENDSLRARAERAEASSRWIPVSERLPDLELGPASHYVHVVYRIPGANYYLSADVQYYKEYGWLYKFQHGKEYSFEDYGYVVDYWREFSPLPELLQDHQP
jgi:hypothetical protein